MKNRRPELQAIYEWVEAFAGEHMTGNERLNLCGLIRKECEGWRALWIQEAADIARESVKHQILFNHMVSADKVAKDILKGLPE